MAAQSQQAFKVVCAPDSFKGTFSAAQVAERMSESVRALGGETVLLPIADGGEGTIDTIHAVLGGEFVQCDVLDPSGARVRAPYLRIGNDAYVEMATASGIQFKEAEGFNPLTASTYGTGQQILAAAAAGCERIIVTVGGSATSDGGRGALQAIDDAGGVLDGNPLIQVLTDVVTSYEEAVGVFGPQKGVLPEQITPLTEELVSFACTLPRNPVGVPRTGAGGGLSGALWARHDAELLSGIEYLLELVGFDAAASDADMVLTGEGRFDGQSEKGKVISGVLGASSRLGCPCIVIAGQIAEGGEALAERMGIAEVRTASSLHEIGAVAAESARRRMMA